MHTWCEANGIDDVPDADQRRTRGQDLRWHAMSSADVLTQLRASLAGLSEVESAARRAKDGVNELTDVARVAAGRILASQFKGVIVGLLIVAGGVSAALGQMIDAAAILVVVLLNAAIGFYQEYSAEQSIAALKKLTAPSATVRRDNAVHTVAASDVVVGDILVLEAGDIVAADARVVTAAMLRCLESSLTGESEPVTKNELILPDPELALGDRANMLFMSSSVVAGSGEAVVVATSMNTELGKIAAMLQDAAGSDVTPLQHRLDAFGRILVWASLSVVVILFALGWLRGVPPLELFMTSVGLAVAAVPEGLPAIVTVALSVGVMRMARRKVLVRKLASVETLGSTSVICTDKTGTLTAGEMTVRMLYVAGDSYEVTGTGYGPAGTIQTNGAAPSAEQQEHLQELGTVLIGCNQAHLVETKSVWTTVGDPTEGALLVVAGKIGADRERLEKESPVFAEFPFDSDRKRSSVVRRTPQAKLRAFVNGAPGTVLDACTHMYAHDGVRPMTAADRTHILAQTSSMANRALRVLASANRDLPMADVGTLSIDAVETQLTFVGLTAMYDPPRPEAKAAIAECHAAGIRVVMITGDHPETASAIARELAVTDEVQAAVTGVELESMSDEELRGRVARISVYARVTAQHKLRIVRAWMSTGAVVAMTGDGVNDAPAIKGADIGIAMGKTGTEVTRQAADMIITDDNFATIVAAVEEGRGMYANITKTLQYLLAGNTGELLLMTVCVVIGLPTPLLAIHLLWINIVTDGLPALCLAADPVEADIMQQPPRSRDERITTPGFLRNMILTGSLTAAVSFGVYWRVLHTSTLEDARTSAFGVLVFAELLRAFGARSKTLPVWRIPLRTNRALVAVVALSVGIQFLSQHNSVVGTFLRSTSITMVHGLWLLAVGVVPLLVLEGVKFTRAARPAGRRD